MKYPKVYLVLSLFTILFFSNFKSGSDSKWRSLFNGKDFKGWDTCLGPMYNPATDKFQGNPAGQLLTLSEKSSTGRHCIKNLDTEKPNGQWNTVDIYSFGSTTIHMMNGVINMILYNSRQQEGV